MTGVKKKIAAIAGLSKPIENGYCFSKKNPARIYQAGFNLKQNYSNGILSRTVVCKESLITLG